MNKIIKELANDYAIHMAKKNVRLDVNDILRLEADLEIAFLEGGKAAINELGRGINK